MALSLAITPVNYNFPNARQMTRSNISKRLPSDKIFLLSQIGLELEDHSEAGIRCNE